jgi:AAA domain, putative AbiEii toxin, Type IV TA system
MPKLQRVMVHQLLGQFHHELFFPDDWDFWIIYGPNGVGKTKLLEIIEAAMTQKLTKLLTIPFEISEFDFTDGTTFKIIPFARKDDQEETDLDFGGHTTEVKFELSLPQKETLTWTRSSERSRRAPISRWIEDIPAREVAPDRWMETRTGQVMSTAIMLKRYGDFLDPEMVEILGHRTSSRTTPAEALAFFEKINVHLIETQRLLHSPSARRTRRTEDTGLPGPTVVQYAADLAEKLRDAMTENSRTSQVLDSSFPRRVLEGVEEMQLVTEDEIRARYDQQNSLRERLSEIAVLDVASEVPLLPERPLADWERVFVWQYLDDTDRKLATFKVLLDRVALLRDIVNSRFLYKKMIINRSVGFLFKTDNGRTIDPSDLSSGEQHELVLFYDLLFKVDPNSLVLIDEPEISLHVAWQQSFISDIQRVSQIADLQFIVATHSPQVIHHWWDQAAELAPFEVEKDI